MIGANYTEMYPDEYIDLLKGGSTPLPANITAIRVPRNLRLPACITELPAIPTEFHYIELPAKSKLREFNQTAGTLNAISTQSLKRIGPQADIHDCQLAYSAIQEVAGMHGSLSLDGCQKLNRFDPNIVINHLITLDIDKSALLSTIARPPRSINLSKPAILGRPKYVGFDDETTTDYFWLCHLLQPKIKLALPHYQKIVLASKSIPQIAVVEAATAAKIEQKLRGFAELKLQQIRKAAPTKTTRS